MPVPRFSHTLSQAAQPRAEKIISSIFYRKLIAGELPHQHLFTFVYHDINYLVQYKKFLQKIIPHYDGTSHQSALKQYYQGVVRELASQESFYTAHTTTPMYHTHTPIWLHNYTMHLEKMTQGREKREIGLLALSACPVLWKLIFNPERLMKTAKDISSHPWADWLKKQMAVSNTTTNLLITLDRIGFETPERHQDMLDAFTISAEHEQRLWLNLNPNKVSSLFFRPYNKTLFNSLSSTPSFPLKHYENLHNRFIHRRL